jgi:radical SAM protein with 4Fe4S-binding SPASM domain
MTMRRGSSFECVAGDVPVTRAAASAEQHDDGRRTARPLRDGLYALAAARAVPLKAVIEVTRRCNLRCYHCYVEDAGRELPTDRLVGLLQELAEQGCLMVTLTGGEVALRDDFLELAAAVKRQRMQLSVLTNGTAFTQSDLESLARLKPARVAVSVYGVTPEAHERVTGVPGSFEQAMTAVRALRSLGVQCCLHGTLLKESCEEFAKVADLAEELGCDWRFDPTVVPTQSGGGQVVEHRVSVEQLQEFFFHPKTAGRTKEYAASRDGTTIRRRATNCGAGSTSVFVSSDGDVYACMGFAPAFGNIAHRSFSDVWCGAEAEAHRQRMREPLVTCDACELLRYCTIRCPRLAAVEDGDLSGPSARACELAGMVRDWRESLQSAALDDTTVLQSGGAK